MIKDQSSLSSEIQIHSEIQTEKIDENSHKRMRPKAFQILVVPRIDDDEQTASFDWSLQHRTGDPERRFAGR